MNDHLFEPDNLDVASADEVAAARDDLRGMLSELRQRPGCPEGEDDAIVGMSYPPAYTASPNPYIAGWLEGHEPKDEDDREDPGPFAADVSVGKGNPFYKAHSYPTKVPHPAIMRFLLHYTRPGDVVLDGFAGTGMTGLAAQACGKPDPKVKREIESEFSSEGVEWGTRRAVLSDLGPAATFIGAGLNLPVDADAFDRASRELLDRFAAQYGWMYRTTVHPDVGSSFEADIDYTIWSEVHTCPHCGAAVVFYEAAFDPDTGRVRDSYTCPSCQASLTKASSERRFDTIRTLRGDTIKRVAYRPVRVAWRNGQVTGLKRFDEGDQAILDRIAGLGVSGFPSDSLPIGTMVHGSRLAPKGFTHVHHLWSDRALASLTVLWSWAREHQEPLTSLALKFWVEQAFWGLSWMNRYKGFAFGKLGGSQVNQQLSGVYYVPALHAECSPRYNLEGSSPSRGKRQSLVKMWRQSPARRGNVAISTGSSAALPIPDGSIDYVFVDPPFGANIPYSDLALVTEMWHGVGTDSGEEATEDKFKGRGRDAYETMIAQCFAEFFRVLKPGRWMTVEFSNSSNDVWLRIQNALASAGFVVADTRIIDKEQLSYRQVTAGNAVKHDLVISAYRPAESTEHTFSLSAGSVDGAWTFVREHLSRIPAVEGRRGQALVMRERQADRMYERMVAFHVARNVLVPMTAAEFYTGLDQRLPLRDGMYFLPDQVEAYERFRITFKELAQQTLMIRDESSAVQWLRQLLKSRPRTFSDIHPLFMAELQSAVADWEQMPDLREMLEDNFVVDDDGRWQVPDPKRAEHLDQLRTRALLREFDTYRDGSSRLSRFRTEAVRVGFKTCWANKEFDTIVKVGRRLPEDVYIEDSALLHYLRNAERLAA